MPKLILISFKHKFHCSIIQDNELNLFINQKHIIDTIYFYMISTISTMIKVCAVLDDNLALFYSKPILWYDVLDLSGRLKLFTLSVHSVKNFEFFLSFFEMKKKLISFKCLINYVEIIIFSWFHQLVQLFNSQFEKIYKSITFRIF